MPDFPWGFDLDEAPDWDDLPGVSDDRTISTTDPDEDGVDMDTDLR